MCFQWSHGFSGLASQYLFDLKIYHTAFCLQIMKFGLNLHRYQIVEWIPFYINYNGLKKLYKLAAKLAIERGENADFTGLSLTL